MTEPRRHPLSLEGRVAVVMGGTTGIGRAISLGLADAGADVVATGRRLEPMEEVAAMLEARGCRTVRQPTDVTDRAQIERLLEVCVAEFGRVDVLVNCAGKIRRRATLEVSDEEWRDVMETNVTGVLRTCQVFGRSMLERGYGRIVNIASLSSFVGLHEVAAYGASKSALVSLTRSLAVEWSRHGVVVNAIAPGVFRTDLNAALLDSTPRGQEFLLRTPMGRFGRTEELVGAAIYLSSEAASFTSGQTIVVDGGFLASGVNQ